MSKRRRNLHAVALQALEAGLQGTAVRAIDGSCIIAEILLATARKPKYLWKLPPIIKRKRVYDSAD